MVVFATSDNGKLWKDVSDGLPSKSPVFGLIVYMTHMSLLEHGAMEFERHLKCLHILNNR